MQDEKNQAWEKGLFQAQEKKVKFFVENCLFLFEVRRPSRALCADGARAP
jgi:hypothetical protein